MVDLGTAYEARSCRIVRILLDRGAVTETRMAEMLNISVQLLRETESRMIAEDILFWMSGPGGRTLFLCDRHGWSARIRPGIPIPSMDTQSDANGHSLE